MRNTRLIGVLVFSLAVGAVQVLESLYLWYSYREERVQLTQLREELVDQGAEMIRAQLEAEQIRARIAATDSVLDRRRQEVEAQWHGGVAGMRSHVRYPAHVRYPTYVEDVDAFNREVRRRNQRLNELSSVVSRRNAAAVRYHVLADSIRSLAVRAREPYFSVPIPAQAAAERGITRDPEHLAVGAWGEREGGGLLRENR